MIKYQLVCTAGHEFEAWFGSINAFDTQSRCKQVACPACGTSDVEKRPMAPAVVSSRMKSRIAAASTSPPANLEAAMAADPDVKAAIDALREMKSQVLANTENVGDNFAEEARRMHFGEAPERSIRGAATTEQAQQLHDDGIDFGILPRLPDEQN